MNFTSTGTTEPSYQVKYIQDGIQCIAYHSKLLVPPPSTNRTDPDQTLPCSMQQKSFKLGPETYVTSPKVFARGDKAFWQHGYGLMSEVEITPVTISRQTTASCTKSSYAPMDHPSK
jgi:hypothetical protein